MLGKLNGKLTNRNNVIAIVLAGSMSALTVLNAAPVKAGSFTSGSLLEKMNNDQINFYLTGLVDGLAYARYEKEGKKTDGGMKCIYNWFEKRDGTIGNILAAFRKYPKYTPNAIVAALLEKECGK